VNGNLELTPVVLRKSNLKKIFLRLTFLSVKPSYTIISKNNKGLLFLNFHIVK